MTNLRTVRDNVVQYSLEICRFEICRSKKKLRLAYLRNLLICEQKPTKIRIKNMKVWPI